MRLGDLDVLEVVGNVEISIHGSSNGDTMVIQRADLLELAEVLISKLDPGYRIIAVPAVPAVPTETAVPKTPALDRWFAFSGDCGGSLNDFKLKAALEEFISQGREDNTVRVVFGTEYSITQRTSHIVGRPK